MTNNIYDYISLCEVMASKDDGGPTLLRLADIGENQKLQPFIFDESRLPKWDNRKYLFNQGNQNKVSKLGYWKWNAKPNNNDPNDDYITSENIQEMNPVLVIKLSNTTSKEEIIAELRKGIIRNSRYYCDVLFVFSCDIDHLFYGILCEENSLEDGNNIYKLKETQSILGVYKFHWDNIIEIFDSQKRCNLNILAEHELMEIVCEVYIKDKQVAVNDIIKSHFTKAEYQKIYGGTRSDVQKAKSFFDKLLDKTILQEITTKVKVSEEEAKGLLQNACKQADANILNLDLENSVLLNFIQNDDTLRKRCELIIEENWKKNHNTVMLIVVNKSAGHEVIFDDCKSTCSGQRITK